MKSLKYKSITLVAVFLIYSCNQQKSKENTSSHPSQIIGPYLGQKLPDTTPQIFAPGVVSTDLNECDIAISPDRKEIYFSIRVQKFNRRISNIIYTKQINGVWSKPEIVSFSGQFKDDCYPFIQADGKRMYFSSERPLIEGEKNKYIDNIWYVDKTENGWSEPKPFGEPINGQGSVFRPSIAKSGTMYFLRENKDKSKLVYRSKLVEGRFTTPELLPEEINVDNLNNAFISPDEEFLIVSANIENNTYGDYDYYVSFRDENDKWSELINLGNAINTPGWELSPSLSPDGKYFFFQRDAWIEPLEEKTLNYNDLINLYNGRGDIYWVDASVITSLKHSEKK